MPATHGSDTSMLGRRETGSTPTWRPWSTFSHRDGASVSPTGARTARWGPQATEAARESGLLVSFSGEINTDGAKTPCGPPSALPGCRARPRLSTTTQSHLPPPALASSYRAARCWLGTTPPEGRSERHTTAPRSVQRLPGLAQNGYQDSTYLAVEPRAAWPHRRPNTAVGGSMTGSKIPKSLSSGICTNL